MDVMEVVRADRIVAVVRAERVADPPGLAAALAGAGVRCVEFTFTIAGVLEALKAAAGNSDAVIGAGTVLHADQARAAIDAGARFVVSPAARTGLADLCREAGVPLFLGALTPTEVAAALDEGAAAVKLFPAGLGGPHYLEDLRGPFPCVSFLPSGGVDEGNARDYLDAGATAVYAGSSLVPPELAVAGKNEEVRQRAARFAAAVR
jgi:2-dehydro-3-deoxyphosphogluconate aldolase/(4S)-4-hydroxy-2-oxoglutarate aldolase